MTIRPLTSCHQLGAEPDAVARPKGLLAQVTSLGWAVLAERPGREIVAGAITQPWMANVVFQALPPDRFRQFLEPGYVKIVWTLRADPVGMTRAALRFQSFVRFQSPTEWSACGYISRHARNSGSPFRRLTQQPWVRRGGGQHAGVGIAAH